MMSFDTYLNTNGKLCLMEPNVNEYKHCIPISLQSLLVDSSNSGGSSDGSGHHGNLLPPHQRIGINTAELAALHGKSRNGLTLENGVFFLIFFSF